MKKGKTPNMLSPENYIRKKARSLPVYKCLLNAAWKNTGMAHLCLVRQHINGNFTAGFFLVDLLCMGVKDSHYVFNYPDFEFKEVLENFQHDNEFIEIDYTLAHNIIYAGLEFGEENGFKPCKEFAVSIYLLEEDNDEIELIDIECGTNGKPTILKGPYNMSEANRAIAILKKTVGTDNYTVIQVSQDNLQEDDDFEDDDLTDKEIRFIELTRNTDKLSNEEEREVISLSGELFDQYLDDQIYDAIYDDFEIIFDLEIDDTYYDGLIGIPNLNEKDANKILKPISEIVHLAHLKSKHDKARKKLSRLIKTYGNIPILEKMELFILHEEGKDSELLHHKQAMDRYPDYAMLKFQFFNRILEDSGSFDNFDYLLNDVDFLDFFKSRQKIHSSELLEFLLLRFNLAKNTYDLETIEAVFNVLLKLSENNDEKWMLAIIMIISYKMEFLSNDLFNKKNTSDKS